MTRTTPLRSFTIIIALAMLASFIMMSLMQRGGGPTRHYEGYAPPGTPLPEIHAAGWLNGDAPTPESLKGKVIVVDAWATWCGPCRAAMPHLVELHEKYQDRVLFIGLTSEGPESASQVQSVLDSYGATYLNGYGAGQVLSELGADYIPAYWIAGPDGTILWNSNSGEMEQGIQLALKNAE